MHQHIINASIQILPIAQDRHQYLWVDEAIAIIQNTGIKYKIGPFATVVEGTYEEVMNVIHSIDEHLALNGCNEWITSIQLNIRGSEDITANEKVAKFIQQK